MDITLIFLFSLALGGGALAFVLYPLWQQTRPEAIFRLDHSGQTLAEYEARYQAALAAIRDLMFDYEMGKVSAADYQELLQRTKLEAAEIRRQIDRLSQNTEVEIKAEVDAEIESQVAKLARRNLTENENFLEEVEAEIAALKERGLKSRSGKFSCPQCGKQVVPGDAFCAGCGYSLAELHPEVEDDENICPECGYAFQPDDAFCAKCGFALNPKSRLTEPNDTQITEPTS